MKLEEKYEDISGVISDAVNRRTDNTKTRRKWTKGQSTILKTIHIQLKMVLQINRSITQKINKKSMWVSFVLIVPFVIMLYLCYLLFCSLNVSTCNLYTISYLNFVLDWCLHEYFVIMDLSHYGCQLQLKIKWKSYIVNKRKKIA